MSTNGIIVDVVCLIISLLSLLIGKYLVPFIKEKLTGTKFDKFLDYVKFSVKCAELTIKDTDESGKTGANKKAFVVNFLKGILIKLNIELTDEELDVIIESAVEDLKILSETAKNTEE